MKSHQPLENGIDKFKKPEGHWINVICKDPGYKYFHSDRRL